MTNAQLKIRSEVIKIMDKLIIKSHIYKSDIKGFAITVDDYGLIINTFTMTVYDTETRKSTEINPYIATIIEEYLKNIGY